MAKPELTSEQIAEREAYQRAAMEADEAIDTVLKLLAEKDHNQMPAHVAGAVAAATRHYCRTAITAPVQLQHFTVRDVFTHFLPIINATAEQFVEAIRQQEVALDEARNR